MTGNLHNCSEFGRYLALSYSGLKCGGETYPLKRKHQLPKTLGSFYLTPGYFDFHEKDYLKPKVDSRK